MGDVQSGAVVRESETLGARMNGDGVHDLGEFHIDYVNPVGAGCCHVHETSIGGGHDAIGLRSDAELSQYRERLSLQDGQCG